MAELYDIHCHVLPGIDDGSADLAMTLELLRESARQGITHMAATPHYYSRKPVEEFLAARDAAYRLVCGAIAAENAQPGAGDGTVFPQIVLGAEVAYHRHLAEAEDLKRLCMNGTRYLLLEMPFREWTPADIAGVEKLAGYHGVTPIIAHLERFYSFQGLFGRKKIDALLELPVLVQINAEFILSEPRKAEKLIRADKVHFIGSDCHNTTTRPQNLRAAAELLAQRGLTPALQEFAENSELLFP